MTDTMKHGLKLILISALIAGAMLAHAQGPEADPVDTEELREQLEQTRMELAEVAQRLARLQRELILTEGDPSHWHFRTRKGEFKDFQFDFKFDEERLGHLAFAGFPPRMGLLLGSPDVEQGLPVVGVTPGSGAEKAGIQRGDRLIAVNGQQVSDDPGSRIRDLLADQQAGDSVDVVLWRDGKEQSVAVTLSSAMDMLDLGNRLAPLMEGGARIIHFRHDGSGMPAPLHFPARPSLMAGLGHDTDLIANHSGLEPYFGTGEGILVLRAAEDNPLNLESGDVILSIDGETVSRPVDLGRLLLKHDAGDEITVQVMRQGMPTELYGTIPEQNSPAPKTSSPQRHRGHRG
jgi:C-terminal processing protease CtpA/Prc